ncbi:MAG: NAD(P)/FAD-dependent oxidoreductase [Bacilli bacterium]|nr:NAD(P)/FAD-dependent oxidoreductase [Bacilli bacterium]MBN2696882.1 NAD(P)/FAD-dependent oxidoreductase [Bacilli bacterium]
MYDSIIIGAGVIGANIARELARYDLKIAVLEKMSDVCEATSKGNSGIVHSGYDAKPGTLKAKYNLTGNQMMPELCRKLNIPFRQNGSLTIVFNQEKMAELEKLIERGIENGVSGLMILDRETTMKLEPNLNDAVVGSLYAPTAGIVDPFQLTIGPAEIAVQNGVKFFLSTEVTGLYKTKQGFLVKTNNGNFEALTVINAAGVFADDINNWISERKRLIRPRKGEYCLFDKEVGNLVEHTIFQLPSGVSKGVLVTPTAEGNLLIGPNSLPDNDKFDILTSAEGIQYVLDTAKKSVRNLPTNQIITGFAGLRASEKDGDFVLGEPEDVPGFFNALGIESPGLTAAPAIAVDLATWVAEYLRAQLKAEYIEKRVEYHRFADLSTQEKQELFKSDHDYGKVICRCELVTLAEIKNAIRRPLGATTLDGIKRRTRAGSGRCQGGFCSPRILEILSEELRKDIREIVKSSEKSTYLVGFDKDML